MRHLQVTEKPPRLFCPGHFSDGKPPDPYRLIGPPCCPRAGEYNGFGSGPIIFTCPKHCSCHD